jgi:hypothetical protein
VIPRNAVDNDETLRSPRFDHFGRDVLNNSQRWCVSMQTKEERLHGRCGSFDLDENALGTISDPTGETQFARKVVHVGAKADTLNDSEHADVIAEVAGIGEFDLDGVHLPSPLEAA